MGAGSILTMAVNAPLAKPCQFIVRQQEGPSQFLRFVLEGLEAGQPVVALAGAGCLTHVARALTESGFQPQALLRGGRLVFFTAPDCFEQFHRPDGALGRAPLRRPGPLIRWVSDWSWAYSNGRPASVLLDYQHRVHRLLRSVEALSLCTVHSRALERRALLAVLADHRQAAKLRVAGVREILPCASFAQ